MLPSVEEYCSLAERRAAEAKMWDAFVNGEGLFDWRLVVIDDEGDLDDAASHVDPREAFREEIRKHFGCAPPRIIADGKSHRFSVDPKNRRNDSGEYRYYDGEFPHGWAKNWRDPNSYFSWNAREVRTLSDADRERYDAEKTRRARDEAEEAAKARTAAIARAGRRWGAARSARNDHPYLSRKGVLAHGIRQTGNTLLVPAYLDGELVTVQRIFPCGKKLFEKDAPKRGSYFTIDEIGDPAVIDRLGGDFLIICEGYATGATLFEATGIPIVVAFDASNLMPVAEKLLELHPDTTIIVAADDDLKTFKERGFNPGGEAAEKVAEFVGTREMAPPFDRVRDGDEPSDWNDYAEIYGPVAVHDAFFPPAPEGSNPQGRPEPTPASVIDYRTIDEATEITKDIIASFMAHARRWNKFEIREEMPVYFFSPDVGIGKSHTAMEATIDLLELLRGEGNKGVVQFLVPNHKLSHETVDKFYKRLKEHGLEYVVHLHKSRLAKIDPFDPETDSPKMCAISEEYEIASQVMSEKEICNKDCPHREGCPYIDQFRVGNVDILVTSHHMLFAPILKQIKEGYVPVSDDDVTRGVAAIVIDESFLPAISSTGGRRTIAIDEISAPLRRRKGYDEKSIDSVAFDLDLARSAIVEALNGEPDGYVRRKAFAKLREEFTSEMAIQAALDEWKFVIGKNDGEDWRLRGINRLIITRINMFYAVAALLDDDDDPERSGLLKIVKDKGGHRDLQVHKRNVIHKDYMITPMLFIDANLKPELLEVYLGQYAKSLKPLKVGAQYQTIHQAEGRSWSMSDLCPKKGMSEKDIERLNREPGKLLEAQEELKNENERRRQNRIKSRNDVLALQRAYGGEALVVTYKAVEESEEFRFGPESNIYVEHFGAIRGTNKYEKARLVIIIGRPLAAPAGYEEALGVLTGAAPEKALGDNKGGGSWWFRKGRRPRLRRLKDGRVIEEMVTTWVHPNSLVEALMIASCADEITQAIGRGRGVRREVHEPLDVVVFTDVPLGVPVDHFFRADPAPTSEQKMLEEGGFAFTQAPTMALAYPSLWKTEAAAKSALRRDRERKPEPGSVAVIISPPAPELVPVHFQRAAAGGAAIEEAAFDPGRVSGDPEAALAALVGELSTFEIEILGQKAETAPKLSALADRILAILAAFQNRTKKGHLLLSIYLKASDPGRCGFEPSQFSLNSLRRKLKVPAAELAAEIDELEAAGLIESKKFATGKRQATFYSLAPSKPQDAPATAPATGDLPFITVEDAVIVETPEPPPPEFDDVEEERLIAQATEISSVVRRSDADRPPLRW
jgi:putative DNA primase/helicase